MGVKRAGRELCNFPHLVAAEQGAICLNCAKGDLSYLLEKSKCMSSEGLERDSLGKLWKEGFLISRCDEHPLSADSVELQSDCYGTADFFCFFLQPYSIL